MAKKRHIWTIGLLGLLALVPLFVALGGSRGGTSQSPPAPVTAAPAARLEVQSVIGPELTEGYATAASNAPKLAVDSRGGVHVVYQYDDPFGKPATLIYAYSPAGRSWKREQWQGRYPALVLGPEDRLYLVYIKRTPQHDQLWLRSQVIPAQNSHWRQRLLLQAMPNSLFSTTLAAGPQALLLVWKTHQGKSYALDELRLPWGYLSGPAQAPPLPTRIVSGSRGLYLPALLVDKQGREQLVWEAERDAAHHLLQAALRVPGGNWQIISADLTSDITDARSASLSMAADGQVLLAFVAHGTGLRSALYTARYAHGSWQPPHIIDQIKKITGQAYDQLIEAFPAQADGLLIWGHTVPAACGSGPFSWVYQDQQGRWSAAERLSGDFASFPQLIERPRGVWHLVWNDRNTKALRAFEVRYLRLQLIPAR